MTLKLRIQFAWWNFKERWQRFIRGYSYGDVWSMDCWFMKTIKPMLIHLRDRGCGVPGNLWNEEEDSRKAWEAILTEMINCLDMMDEDKVYEALFGEDWFKRTSTYEEWQQVHEIQHANKDRFFELFSKYFYHLWD